MWNDYDAVGGTFRENLYGTPGKPYLPDHHPGSKFKWNVVAPKAKKVKSVKRVNLRKSPRRHLSSRA